jgi:glycosyltransferase involved in cell wall biosynthesis
MAFRRGVFVTPMLPPLDASEGGGKHRRTRIFLRALADVSDRLDILYLVPERLLHLASDPAALDRGQSAFWGVDLNVSLLARATRRETAWNHYALGILDAAAQPTLFPYASATLRPAVARHVEGADCVFADRLDAMLALPRGGRVLFDMDDVSHMVLLRDLRHGGFRPGKLGLALHLPALIQAERHAVADARMTFVCSDADAARLRRLARGGDVRVVPNAIVPPADPPGLVAAPTVLFLGAYHYQPNRDAAERLATRVWPLVRAEIPPARLILAGAGGDTLPSARAGLAGVDHRGFVDDLDALYAETRVVCSPLTRGGGTRLKLIEAAAYARPMVSTRMGADGLAFRDGGEILLRDSDAALARGCVDLLRDDALCRRLGDAARQAMLARYDAGAVARDVADMLRASGPS